MDFIDAFRSAISAAGLEPPAQIIADGSRQRFSTNGKSHDKSGWYRLHGDERPAGAFGCWRTGFSATWKHDVKREFSAEERAAWKKRMAEMEAQRVAERKEAAEYAAKTAAQMWAAAREDAGHDYLTRKKIPLIGARVLKDMVLIPIKQSAKELVGLQRIWPDGNKRPIKGTPMVGAYTVIGKPDAKGRVLICEGWATGVSIHMATKLCVVVAFNSGNLAPVAAKIAKMLPTAELVVAADDDAFTVYPPNHPKAGQPWNPGRESALATGLPVYMPRWYGDRGEGTDFNDLHLAEGLGAVAECFAEPITPAPQPEPEPEGPPPAGEPDEDRAPSGGLMIYASRPMETARLFHDTRPVGGRIIFWRGEFYCWAGFRYEVCDVVAIEQQLYHFMAACTTTKENPRTGKVEVVAFNPKKSHIADVVHALRAVCYANLDEPQCWIDRRAGDPEPGDILAFRNGFLHWPTRTLMPATDRLFLISALDFDYNPKAGPASEWLGFLANLWPTDAEAIDSLAEMFGYLLTDRTDQHKMFMLIGPPRSGKGTILRVLECLVGMHNRVSPSLAGIGTQFGLQPLIGKRLAMISDARLSGRADQQPIVENLLRISGEDSITVDRKNLTSWSGKLAVRFVMATNELPAFTDASAALANRFVVFKFINSFIGKEDHGLTNRLLKELPSIVLWALDGLDRLQERGYLIEPKSSLEIAQAFMEQTSPIRTFVDERCFIIEGSSCEKDDLFAAWKLWCEEQGMDHPGTKVTFGRRLIAAYPTLSTYQPRDGGTRKNMYLGIRLRTQWDVDAAPV